MGNCFCHENEQSDDQTEDCLFLYPDAIAHVLAVFPTMTFNFIRSRMFSFLTLNELRLP